jgi:hypothetical protein
MKKPTKAELKAANTYEGLTDATSNWDELDYNEEIRKAFVAGMRYQKKQEGRVLKYRRIDGRLITER